VASFFQRFNSGGDAADDGGLPTSDGSSRPSWGWLDASAALSCDRAPGRAADAAWSESAGVERLQSFAASRHAPLASPAASAPAGSSFGASGATSPDPALAADVAGQEQNGSLSYNAVLTILDSAAAGGMTAAKFAALQSFAAELNAPGGISVTAYVQQITDDVIDGNSANATWNGGAPTATELGDLTAASSQTQADDLIGEWFLGANLPSLSLTAVGQANLSPAYRNSTLPLYGPSGAPTSQDVNQGYLGDCYFLSSLGDIALKDPSAIESMITSNGNGTYGVRFMVDGQPDYVTVNSELPVMGAGYQWANGSTLEFANGSADDWVGLVEKAYAELNAQTSAPHGMELNSASDSYQGIAAGNASALTLVTGQSETGYALNPQDSAGALASIMSSLASSFSAGEEVLMSTPASSSGNLVGDHMYMITGVNAATDTFTIQNPWNSAYSGPLAMTFTESIQALAQDNCSLYAASGRPVA
jgi:Calpain family cysteine protease